jgi:predicted CopG family antitoxin
MMTIDIDFDVFKELTHRRSSEEVTYNDVIRELLGLSIKRRVPIVGTTTARGDWVTKGVRFPLGTEFRANYKSQTYRGKVEDGKLIVDNKRFDSASAAAGEITGKSVNGWTFWECRMPGESKWQTIKFLRR